MAEQPNADRVLGGFAQLEFVLINSSYWDSKENRRYVQGQAWITEFTNILFVFINWKHRVCWPGLMGPQYPNYETNQLEPLGNKGSLEILIYCRTNSALFTNNVTLRQSLLAAKINNIRILRNTMTHETKKWLKDRLANTLVKLLQEMKVVSMEILTILRGFAKPSFVSQDEFDEFSVRLKKFIENCVTEEGHVKSFPSLY